MNSQDLTKAKGVELLVEN